MAGQTCMRNLIMKGLLQLKVACPAVLAQLGRSMPIPKPALASCSQFSTRCIWVPKRYISGNGPQMPPRPFAACQMCNMLEATQTFSPQTSSHSEAFSFLYPFGKATPLCYDWKVASPVFADLCCVVVVAWTTWVGHDSSARFGHGGQQRHRPRTLPAAGSRAWLPRPAGKQGPRTRRICLIVVAKVEVTTVTSDRRTRMTLRTSENWFSLIFMEFLSFISSF